MSNWRQNPHLVECFDNCVAMFRGGLPAPLLPSRETVAKQRRLALGLSRPELARVAGYTGAAVYTVVAAMERGNGWNKRIADTLGRLEAERAA